MKIREFWGKISNTVDKITGAGDLFVFLEKIESKKLGRQPKPTPFVAAESYGPQGACKYDPSQTLPPVDPATVDPQVKDWYFDEYQQEALKTAQCPLIGHPVVYPFLGVSGEVGEVYEKLVGYIQKDMGLIWKYPTRGEIIKELGDVMWYVAVMADRLGLKMEKITSGPSLPVENSMKHFCLLTREQGVNRATSYDIQLCLNKLVIAQGRLSERLKKVFRDGAGKIEGDRRDSIIHELSELLWSLARLCLVMRINMSLVAHMNIEKLRSRRERNAIQGEGDNR